MCVNVEALAVGWRVDLSGSVWSKRLLHHDSGGRDRLDGGFFFTFDRLLSTGGLAITCMCYRVHTSVPNIAGFIPLPPSGGGVATSSHLRAVMG